VNGFGWNLGYSESIVWSCPRQILGAIRAEARAGELVEILFFCQVNNARLYRFRSAKFHEICTQYMVLRHGESFWKTFCENLPVRGLFFPKTSNFAWSSSMTSDFRPWFLRNDYKSWKVMTGWRAYGMLAFHPYCWLESTQSQSPGSRLRTRKDFPMQGPYTEWLSSTHRCRTAMQLAHAALTWHYIIIKSFAGRQHHLDVALLLSFE